MMDNSLRAILGNLNDYLLCYCLIHSPWLCISHFLKTLFIGANRMGLITMMKDHTIGITLKYVQVSTQKRIPDTLPSQ